ncbi:MAG: reverse transcriptase domain-containing protein, partial [Cyanobacteria bacterium J06553_1]
MTTVKMVRQTLRQGWFMASVDLKDAYWHVPIAKSFRPYLAFSAGQRTYQFRVLPFGLNIAPRIFTKVLQPLHSKLTAHGVHLLMYLDDWP